MDHALSHLASRRAGCCNPGSCTAQVDPDQLQLSDRLEQRYLGTSVKCASRRPRSEAGPQAPRGAQVAPRWHPGAVPLGAQGGPRSPLSPQGAGGGASGIGGFCHGSFMLQGRRGWRRGRRADEVRRDKLKGLQAAHKFSVVSSPGDKIFEAAVRRSRAYAGSVPHTALAA